MSLVDVRRDAGALAEAQISQQDAEKAALSSVGGTHVESSQLVVTFDSAGDSHQIWQVALAFDDPSDGATAVFVDAITGEVVDAPK